MPPELHHALGLMYVRIRNMDAALSQLEKAYHLDKNNARYGYVYAIALDHAGEKSVAIE